MKFRTLIAVSLSCILAACGGGGGSSSSSDTSTTTQTAAATVLSGTGGDMSKYVGTWQSNCGYNLFGSDMGKYQVNVFSISSANGATATGTLTVSYYSDISCTQSVFSTSAGTYSITLLYQSNLAVTSDTPPSMTGSADQLSLSLNGQSSPESFSAGFVGGFRRFYAGTNSFFNSAALAYTKS